MPGLNSLRIKIYGANIDPIAALAANPLIKGFATDPTLMRKAGGIDCQAFAQALPRKISDRPVRSLCRRLRRDAAAFRDGRLPDSFDHDRHHKVGTMKAIKAA